MPRLEYFVVCRSVLKDVDTDEITLAHVLDDVFPAAFPNLIPAAVAISLWNVDVADTIVGLPG